MNTFQPTQARAKCQAFTLIELLVVVGIIALLIAIILPSLSKARDNAKTAACGANLHGIGNGLVVYQTENDNYVVPSYNMKGSLGDTDDPLDGWAPILDRDGVIRQSSGTDQAGSAKTNVFYCPSTLDLAGMREGNSKPLDASRGWMDWPTVRGEDAMNVGTTIPDRGFVRLIRVAYWINADNPIGAVKAFDIDKFYTSSVGYKGTGGTVMRSTRATQFRRPSNMIALADGLYAGRQGESRPTNNKNRIGFRHRGDTAANAAFADGHVETIRYDKFPRTAGSEQGTYTVYADPERWP
jgi:prepilin-type N-terminal cleavage/methylation domain-containing protein/prepilin-type processing-associated H-X9-DG protein